MKVVRDAKLQFIPNTSMREMALNYTMNYIESGMALVYGLIITALLNKLLYMTMVFIKCTKLIVQNVLSSLLN